MHYTEMLHHSKTELQEEIKSSAKYDQIITVSKQAESINNFKIKNEIIDKNNDDSDLVLLNTRNRIIFMEGKENLYDNFRIKEEMGIGLDVIQDANTQKSCCKDNGEFKSKDELLRDENVNPNLLKLNSGSRIMFKEDIEYLYENHTIKEELVLGPEIIQEITAKTPFRERIIFSEDKIASVKDVEKPYKCDLCCKYFTIKVCYEKHIRKCGNIFTCDYCEKICYSRPLIKHHIKRHMKKQEKNHKRKSKPKNLNLDHICKICDKKFALPESLENHMKLHNNSMKCVDKLCNICGKDFATSQNLVRHLKIVHAGKKPHSCKECGKSFTHKKDFEYHIERTHLISFEPKVSCVFCKNMYSGKSNCKRHEKYYCPKNEGKINKVQLRHTCNICQKPYRHKDSLTKHLKSHFGTNIRYQCDICTKSYTRKYKLRQHIQSQHFYTLKVLSCTKCKSTFTSRWGFIRHTCATCAICQSHFERKDSLARHIEMHQGRRPAYQCDTCNKIYSSKKYIRIHIKTIHMKLRAYSCQKCKGTFISQRDLKIHAKKH